MLQKDKFATTSSKSTTVKAPQGVDTPIQFVKGVGPKLGAVFNSREIQTVRDLFYFFPRDYEDRSQVFTVSALQDGAKATLSVRVLSSRSIPMQKLGRSLFEARCSDESSTGILSLKWFYLPKGLDRKLVPGAQFVVTGKVKAYMGRMEMVHPEITWGVQLDESQAEGHSNVGRVVPVYVELEGVPSRTFRKVLWEALEKFGGLIPEDLPAYLLSRRKLPQAAEAVRSLHFPPEGAESDLQALMDFNTPAHRRLIYGEFFKFEYLMLRKKLNLEKAAARAFGLRGGVEFVKSLILELPFRLTGGQLSAIGDILEDLRQSHPMDRLVQGDVGSGKTAVAFLTAACVVREGHQVALMAPTEILAEQHAVNLRKLWGDKVPVVLLTGKTSSGERVRIQGLLSSGQPLLVIGTHALLEDAVSFACLSYILIDEQHRFGVDQRRTLRQKGSRFDPETQKTFLPHSLILTATPIPRTLALTAFADLTVSTISELPPGRSPVQTRVVRENSHREKAYEAIRHELREGRQIYFIFPLVNDSEAEGFTHLKSAVAQANYLAEEVFSGYSVGLLHGQLRPEQKAIVMDRFKAGELKILVSTTVVEVGVDVPNASVIAIEHAERFGLSQLHQLRGRVGRGQYRSYCFLFAGQSKTGTVAQRLEVLEQTTDGFKIAEADLEIRGPGEFLGTRQAGGLPFRLGNIVRDRELLAEARDDAMQVLREDPDLQAQQHESLREYFVREGENQFGRLKTF
jgi:ATP-dependent DNA helicase RecG